MSLIKLDLSKCIAGVLHYKCDLILKIKTYFAQILTQYTMIKSNGYLYSSNRLPSPSQDLGDLPLPAFRGTDRDSIIQELLNDLNVDMSKFR